MTDKEIEVVLCFDRDLTVDVNPPADERDAVPLQWVKHWAHEYPAIDVWATGNQHLRSEAAIPGFEELHSLWNEHVAPDITAEYEPAGANPYKPRRRRGLEMIHEFYDHTDGVDPLWFLVIDDVDLSGMDDFRHFYPWELVDWIDDSPLQMSSTACNEPAQSNACDCDLEVTVLGDVVDV